jgi:hypothetical protein
MENGMQAAYDRERQIMPILMDNERDGMRADVDGLDSRHRRNSARQLRPKAENWLRKELRAGGSELRRRRRREQRPAGARRGAGGELDQH